MRLQKIIATIAIFALLPVYSAFAAFDLQEFNQIITDLQNTVSKYAETIKNLQNENAKLKKALDEYKNNVSSIAVSAPSST
jgi:predicted PurR-regulated permease PerM